MSWSFSWVGPAKDAYNAIRNQCSYTLDDPKEEGVRLAAFSYVYAWLQAQPQDRPVNVSGCGSIDSLYDQPIDTATGNYRRKYPVTLTLNVY